MTFQFADTNEALRALANARPDKRNHLLVLNTRTHPTPLYWMGRDSFSSDERKAVSMYLDTAIMRAIQSVTADYEPGEDRLAPPAWGEISIVEQD